MRVVVDIVPKKSSDCIFSKYAGDGCMSCKLDNGCICVLDNNEKCNRLLALNSVEFMLEQTIKYGR